MQTQHKEREPLPQKTCKYSNSFSVEDTSFLSWVQRSAPRNYIWALLLQADERLPPPTQGAHGPGVSSEPDTGQSGSAGPWVQGHLLGTGVHPAAWWVASRSTLMDHKIHLCREISNLFPWAKHVFGSQWFKIPSQRFQRRDKSMFVSSQEIPTTSWQLHNSWGSCRHPETCRPPAGDRSTYAGTMHFPGFFPFSALPHLRCCFEKARIRDVFIRLALLTERINSPWHFDVLNSHHRNLLIFLGGLNLPERDAQCRGEDGFLQEQKSSLALEELLATQGPTLSDFCRDWYFQHVETLRGKNILCVFSIQDFTILVAEQTDSG